MAMIVNACDYMLHKHSRGCSMKYWKSNSVDDTIALMRTKCPCNDYRRAARYNAGFYVVCSCGKLWNPDGLRLGATPAGHGYLMVSKGLLHLVIWESFNGKVPDGLEINHIDGNKHNPKIDNLEAITRSQNQLHAIELGLAVPRKRADSPLAKLTEVDFQYIEDLIIDGYTNEEIAVKLKGVITPGHVCSIRTLKRWSRNAVIYPSLGKIKVRYSFSLEEILAVYFLCRYTDCKMRNISEAYGVDRSTCSRIRSGLLWQTVETYYDYHCRQRLSQPKVRDTIKPFKLLPERDASRAAS